MRKLLISMSIFEAGSPFGALSFIELLGLRIFFGKDFKSNIDNVLLDIYLHQPLGTILNRN